MSKIINFFLFIKYLIFFTVFFTSNNIAKEILIYADSITYDESENIIARGNAKILHKNNLIISDLIIYNQLEEKIFLPSKFSYKDENNNFIEGENGYFSNNLDYAEFDNPKIKLNDGSRIIGTKIKRDGKIDIISKGVYSPCNSKIKIGNFVCPTWQLEGEKILHDNENLFLHQKHSKMRILNTPVFYMPYIVTPSPLRKERKTGFLTPSVSLNFFDTKTSQTTSFPYYFNLSQDKELLFTPMINYGGGVDSSQRFVFDYNQILSGGNFKADLSFDSNLEEQNNNELITDASLITEFNKNLSQKFRIKIDSAIQSSKNYIQKTKPNDELSYKESLSSNIYLDGYNLNKIDDYLKVSLNFYQTNQVNEDNNTLPIVLPKIKYFSGYNNVLDSTTSSNYDFYNIFRDKGNLTHAKKQQKLSHNYLINKEFINYNSKVLLNAEFYNQIFNTEDKEIEKNKYVSGTYYRFFPILGITTKTPFKLKNYNENLLITPKINLTITPGISNSSYLSNEDSTNNDLNLENIYRLNRYSGNDKMDNSKRITYGIDVNLKNINTSFVQFYEFTDNSNFHEEQGNNNNLSDLFGSIKYNNKMMLSYDFRYDLSESYTKKQSLNFDTDSDYGKINLSYLDQNSEDTETVNYSYISKNFAKFSKIKLNGLYDLKKEINKEYSIGYSFFDECFGINIDFNRKSYEEESLKPQDILTLMFSFKNIGSYRSTNLAVSENDKQDIGWESFGVENDNFKNN